MDPVLGALIATVAVTLIIAVAAVLVVRFAVSGTEGRTRAAILTAAAEVIRAIRGRR
ncbi:hypothetical protein ACFU7Y_38640 [Kitasatospora sp. NPDC057542]|uniref:hypothetical protein n=1 Tax=Kitasatospora sp. NPDC057542 TaxID=3346162 RepID=UPI0036C1B3D4